MATSVLNDNPGKVFVVAYHPSSSTNTYGDPMVRTFPSAFYSVPFATPMMRYMPSAFFARRVWSGLNDERLQYINDWQADVNVVTSESSPLNVGVASSYNTSTKILTINIEVYFTANVIDSLTLYAVITESGIISFQLGADSNYVHNHAFREALPKPTPAQWGETIPTNTTTQGTLLTYTYTFDNSTTNYVMPNCEVIVFVRNAANEEVITGNGAPVGSSSPVGIENSSILSENYAVYPNPLSDNSSLFITLTENSNIFYQIYDVFGKIVVSKDMGTLNAGSHQIAINTNSLEKGIYFIHIQNGIKSKTIKVLK
jgi:hypothetical protein